MDNSNYLSILSLLVDITDKYKLNKSHIIIESPSISLLYNFSRAGFITSYYFEPVFDDNTENNNNILKSEINKIEKYHIDFISSNIKYYSVVNKVFPNMYKNYWYSGSSLQMKIRSIFVRIIVLNNKNTGILLLDY